MKNTLLFFALILILFSSCRNRTEDVVEPYSDSMYNEKNKKIEQLADSLVNLSFCDIILGQPLEKTLANAKKNGKIKNLKFLKDKGNKVATCSAIIAIPDMAEEQIVDVKVESFNDTIYNIIITSDIYETYKEIVKLYTNKYNLEYCKFGGYDNDWNNNSRNTRDSYIWSFKNQSIEVSVHAWETRTTVLKNPRKDLPEERYADKIESYFKKILILYSDLDQLEKKQIYDQRILDKENELKIKQDSLDKIIFDKKKKQLEKKVQNDI